MPAESRFELGPALQQADALLSEPHRTLIWATSHTMSEPHRTLIWATPHPTSEPHRTLLLAVLPQLWSLKLCLMADQPPACTSFSAALYIYIIQPFLFVPVLLAVQALLQAGWTTRRLAGYSEQVSQEVASRRGRRARRKDSTESSYWTANRRCRTVRKRENWTSSRRALERGISWKESRRW